MKRSGTTSESLELPPPPEASRILKMAEILEVKNYQRPTGAKGEEKGRGGEGRRRKREKEGGRKEGAKFHSFHLEIQFLSQYRSPSMLYPPLWGL